MTEKLFYADAHMRKFTARVLSCEERGGRFAVTLDRTAFFPEGGGQGGDTGALGGVRVTDTREEKGEIVHFCDAPLVPGTEVTGELDGETRFARMQIHSAEHLVSGHAHTLWGCENIGFHMDEHGATIDFDREIDAEQLLRLERLANEDVWKNLPINILWPAEEELSAMPFRQKGARDAGAHRGGAGRGSLRVLRAACELHRRDRSHPLERPDASPRRRALYDARRARGL